MDKPVGGLDWIGMDMHVGAICGLQADSMYKRETAYNYYSV